MGQSKFLTESVAEVFPIEELCITEVLWQSLPTKDLCSPSLGTAAIHIRHRPYYLCLFVRELSLAESDVGLA
jgi:hypothetical protein